MSTISESSFQEKVIAYAQLRRWRVHHTRASRIVRQDGTAYHATPLTGNAGFPDLILARSTRVVIVELKTDSGRLSLAQDGWLRALGGNRDDWNGRELRKAPPHQRWDHLYVGVWRPSNWDHIEEVLR